jgi:hypothetical protein
MRYTVVCAAPLRKFRTEKKQHLGGLASLAQSLAYLLHVFIDMPQSNSSLGIRKVVYDFLYAFNIFCQALF